MNVSDKLKNSIPTIKQYTFIILGLGVFVSVAYLVTVIDSDRLVEILGIQNAYATMFVLGAIGGFSLITTIPYHIVLMSLASGGLNPVLLGFVTACGVMLGDSVSYLIGRQGEKILPAPIQKRLEKFGAVLEKHPKLVTPFLVLYGALSPLSNDFIVITMGLTQYSYKRVIIPLGIGNIIFNITIAMVGYYSFDSIQNLFY